MNDTDRAIVAAAEERAERWRAYWALETERHPNEDDARPQEDRRELLRIVREQDALLRERDTQAEDTRDEAAAREATESRWGG